MESTTVPLPAQSGSPGRVLPSPSPRGSLPVPPTERGKCVASVEEATVRPGDPPGATCLLVGATLKVTSAPMPGTFLPLESSEPAVLRCMPTAWTNSTMNTTCTALKPGTAVVSAIVQKRTGGDPPEYVWQLTVRVIA